MCQMRETSKLCLSGPPRTGFGNTVLGNLVVPAKPPGGLNQRALTAPLSYRQFIMSCQLQTMLRHTYTQDYCQYRFLNRKIYTLNTPIDRSKSIPLGSKTLGELRLRSLGNDRDVANTTDVANTNHFKIYLYAATHTDVPFYNSNTNNMIMSLVVVVCCVDFWGVFPSATNPFPPYFVQQKDVFHCPCPFLALRY